MYIDMLKVYEHAASFKFHENLIFEADPSEHDCWVWCEVHGDYNSGYELIFVLP